MFFRNETGFLTEGYHQEIISWAGISRITMDSPCMMRGDLTVCVRHSGSSGAGSGLGQRHCVVFLGKKLYSRCVNHFFQVPLPDLF